MKSTVVCTAIKASSGSFKNAEGQSVNFDSTTFYLNIDLASSQNTKTIGNVSRPFKFGDSKEFDKWASYANKWPDAGILVDVEFAIEASGADGTKLTLKSIKPAAPAQKAAA